MELDAREHRVAVITLHKRGKGPSEIHELLNKPNFSRMLYVRFYQTFTVNNRTKSGRPRLIQTN